MVGVDLNQIKALDVVAYIKLNDFYSSQEVTHLDDAKQQYQELGETILQYLNSQRDEDPQLKKLEDIDRKDYFDNIELDEIIIRYALGYGAVEGSLARYKDEQKGKEVEYFENIEAIDELVSDSSSYRFAYVLSSALAHKGRLDNILTILNENMPSFEATES
jgi:hypothetical protein